MESSTRFTEIRDTTRATPVGSCIYCGRTDQLTDEHIIPLALGGRLILPKSSCPACAAITSTFEHRVLRGFMLDARTAAEYPTRRPENRPESLSLQIERDGVFEHAELAPKEHPALLYLPKFDPPGVLAGRKYASGLSVCGYEAISFGKDPGAVMKDLGVKAIQKTQNWDVTSFARLLSKIGYSYAVASLGLLPREHVTVLPLILGTADDASFWVGSANFQLDIEARSPTHVLELGWIPDPTNVGNELLLVRVKFFVQSGATGYEIVVCRRKASSP